MLLWKSYRNYVLHVENMFRMQSFRALSLPMSRRTQNVVTEPYKTKFPLQKKHFHKYIYDKMLTINLGMQWMEFAAMGC
jgi:hypothetical protein